MPKRRRMVMSMNKWMSKNSLFLTANIVIACVIGALWWGFPPPTSADSIFKDIDGYPLLLTTKSPGDTITIGAHYCSCYGSDWDWDDIAAAIVNDYKANNPEIMVIGWEFTEVTPDDIIVYINYEPSLLESPLE